MGASPLPVAALTCGVLYVWEASPNYNNATNFCNVNDNGNANNNNANNSLALAADFLIMGQIKVTNV